MIGLIMFPGQERTPRRDVSLTGKPQCVSLVETQSYPRHSYPVPL